LAAGLGCGSVRDGCSSVLLVFCANPQRAVSN
jgi:hypothetical protein